MLDVGWSVSIVKMDCGESKGIQQAISRSTGEVFQNSDAALDVNGRLLVESTLSVQVVKENNRPSHTSQAEHVSLIIAEPIVLD